MRVLPVAEIRGSRRDAASRWPTSLVPMTTFAMVVGYWGNSSNVSRRIWWQAMAVRGVFSDGFQTSVSPQTKAIMAFQAQTATGGGDQTPLEKRLVSGGGSAIDIGGQCRLDRGEG